MSKISTTTKTKWRPIYEAIDASFLKKQKKFHNVFKTYVKIIQISLSFYHLMSKLSLKEYQWKKGYMRKWSWSVKRIWIIMIIKENTKKYNFQGQSSRSILCFDIDHEWSEENLVHVNRISVKILSNKYYISRDKNISIIWSANWLCKNYRINRVSPRRTSAKISPRFIY